MLKALLLQQWYRLSDAELEEALNDRVSFRRFLGLSLEDAAPDHTTLCRFRNRLTEQGLADKLFGEFEKQLDRRGLLLKRGIMIDASLIATPHRPGSIHGERTAVDPDAALTARKGKRGTHYGYKMHAGVDQGSRLIRRLTLTPPNINDTTAADAMVSGDEQAVYADKAYAKRARNVWLRSLGIKPRIMHKTWGGGPKVRASQKRHNMLISKVTPPNINDTTAADAMVSGDEQAVYADKAYAKRARNVWLRSLGIKPRIMHKTWGGGPKVRASQKRHNMLISKVRAEVEGVFATLKRWLGFDSVRHRGLAKSAAHLSMVALAYNMKRSLKLAS